MIETRPYRPGDGAAFEPLYHGYLEHYRLGPPDGAETAQLIAHLDAGRHMSCLMAHDGVKLEDIKHVRAHMVLIPQARSWLDAHGITSEAAADSAGAAADLAVSEERDVGVLASEVAADIHGLKVLARDIEDLDHNTTRFLLMAPKIDLSRRAERMLTTSVFEVRNIPAALYKAMGGFATNGVNMTKLESYMVDGSFTATQFYADIEGHPEDANVALALEELRYFTTNVEILGVYPAARARL